MYVIKWYYILVPLTIHNHSQDQHYSYLQEYIYVCLVAEFSLFELIVYT